MTKTETTNFDNELKALSMGVYKGNEKSIPKDWIKVSEYDKKSGFHGEAFYKDEKVVIAMRGTDEIVNDFIKEDIAHLAMKKLPNQYVDNQLGNTYIIDDEYHNGEVTRNNYGENKQTHIKKYHFAENMGDIEDAVEYKPNHLEGRVNMDIDFKDIDTNRVFTNEEIGQMSPDEFSRLENFINQQVAKGKVMPEAQAKQQVQTGNLIYVNSYTRSDGTKVRGYYRSK